MGRSPPYPPPIHTSSMVPEHAPGRASFPPRAIDLSMATRPLALGLLCMGFLGSAQLAGAARQDAGQATLEAPIASALLAESEDVRTFNMHVTTLASPWMEGRVPGTRGMELAREYVQHWMEKTGVEPAFVKDGAASWRQTFELAPQVQLEAQTLRIEGAGLEPVPDVDFRALSVGAAASAQGSPVFIGYGIERGPKDSGYHGYGDDLDLTGKVAVMLRFEPMDAEGKSQWAKRGPWSGRASFSAKIRAASKRNPAAILILNPPDCSDERAGQLPEFSVGREVANVPVLVINLATAERLALALDPEGRSLLELRQLADAGAVAVDWKGRIDISVETASNSLMAENIGGLLRGKGALADELIVMGAHMDHLGMGEFGSRSGPGELHPGADDNATGTAAIIMLAEKLRADYDALPEGTDARSILFLAFDAEESGLNGSRYYVENPIQPLESHALMLNFDMIGRLTDRRLSISGGGTGVGLADLLQPLVEESPLTIVQPEGAGGGSDHLPFLQREIPILFAICADLHDDYHTPRDTSDKINRVDAVHTIDLFHRILQAVTTAPQGWAWATEENSSGPRASASRGGSGRGGIRVRFGIRPSDEAGTADHVAVATVVDGSPAAEAGVESGDVLVEWAGEPVGDIRDWMNKLSQHEPGDEITIKVDRAGQEKTLQVTLGAPAGAGG